jgi:hypothetical protein
MGKYSYFYTEFCINSIFFYLLICLLIFNIKLYLLFSQLWRRAPVVSLMAGSTAGVAMSPWCGGNQTATPPPSYTTYATTSFCTKVFKCYTTKAPEFYTTTYAVPIYYTDALKDGAELRMLPHSTTPRLPGMTLFSSTVCTNFPIYYSVSSCYTEAPADYSTKTVEYYTEAVKYFSPRSTKPQLRRPRMTQFRLHRSFSFVLR